MRSRHADFDDSGHSTNFSDSTDTSHRGTEARRIHFDLAHRSERAVRRPPKAALAWDENANTSPLEIAVGFVFAFSFHACRLRRPSTGRRPAPTGAQDRC